MGIVLPTTKAGQPCCLVGCGHGSLYRCTSTAVEQSNALWYSTECLCMDLRQQYTVSMPSYTTTFLAIEVFSFSIAGLPSAIPNSVLL